MAVKDQCMLPVFLLSDELISQFQAEADASGRSEAPKQMPLLALDVPAVLWAMWLPHLWEAEERCDHLHLRILHGNGTGNNGLPAAGRLPGPVRK